MRGQAALVSRSWLIALIGEARWRRWPGLALVVADPYRVYASIGAPVVTLAPSAGFVGARHRPCQPLGNRVLDDGHEPVAYADGCLASHAASESWQRGNNLAGGRCGGDALCPKPQLLMIDDTVCSPPR